MYHLGRREDGLHLSLFSALPMRDSLPALYTKIRGGRCISDVGTPGTAITDQGCTYERGLMLFVAPHSDAERRSLRAQTRP